MDYLRAVGEWFARRRYLTAVIVAFLAGGLFVARAVVSASSGRISDPIERGTILDAVYGIGTVTANKRKSFNPMVGDTVGRSFVKEGDRVSKGEKLVVTSDGNPYYAPFDGVVNYLPYRPGENAYTTAPMMVVTDMSDVYVVVSMEQQGALRVRVGQTAKLSFDSMRQSTFEGQVAAVYSYSNNFLARIDSVKFPDSVLPDMTCDVAIVVSVHRDALVIPVAAYDSGRVWVKRGHGIPHPVAVKLGIVDGSRAEVLSGDLRPGDRVMIRNQVGP